MLIHTTNEAHMVQLFGLSCCFIPQMRCTWFSYLVWAADSHHKWGALGSATWFELLIYPTNEVHLVQLFGLSCWFTPQMRCTWFSYLVWAADSHHKWISLGSAIWFELLIHTTNEVHLVQLFGLSCWFTPQMRRTWFSHLVERLIYPTNEVHLVQLFGLSCWFTAQVRRSGFCYLVGAADLHHKWGALGSAIWFELLIHTTNEVHLVQLFGLSCWFTPQMRRTWVSYLVWAADSRHKWGALGSAIWFELLIHTTNEADLVQLFGLSCWFTPQMRRTWFSYLVWAADSHYKWGAIGSAIWFELLIHTTNEAHLV